MRAGTLVAILVVALVAVGAWYFIDVDVADPGRAPDVDVTVTDPGEAPDLDVETGDVSVGERTITVPDVDVTPAPAD